MNVIWNKFKYSATGAMNEGGAGGGSLLTTPPSGGGAATPGGNNVPPQGGSADAGGNQPPAGASSAKGDQTSDWKTSLPDELRSEAGLGMFKDVSALAKSYLNAQKMIGADKVVIPGKNATDDDWKGVFSKLGLPESPEKYDLKFQEGVTLDKEFTEDFKKQAHAAGILPKQAQALADWFSKTNQGAEEAMNKQLAGQREQKINELKTEWGAAFDQKVSKAAQVVTELGNPELIEFLEKTGLGNDVRMVKLFSELGEKFLSEGKEVGSKNTNEGQMTPAEARKEHATIMGNMQHPYFIKEHPGHKAAVAEMANLIKMMNPSKS